MSLTGSLKGLQPKQALALALAEKARRQRLSSMEHVKKLKDQRPITSSHSSLLAIDGHPFNDFLRRARFKVFYGGRGAAKSWAAAEALIKIAKICPIRVLCTREYQNSIADSVHQLLSDTIERLGLSSWFHVTAKSITSRAGAEFLFKGLHHNIKEIKSTEGVDICLVEEGQNVSKTSWEILIPTIRKKGSEIWVLFNTDDEHDATYNRFVINTPPNCILHKVNWDQNPFFSEELESERQYYLQLVANAETDEDREQAQADYDHVWEGYPRRISSELIMARKVVVQGFDEDLWKIAERRYLGADFGFAQDPSTLISSFIIDNTLYVEHEGWGLHVELRNFAEFYDQVPDSRRWTIKADCSRPETISHIRSLGFSCQPAEKWPGSVEDGIAHLHGFKKIIIHPRCKYTIQESKMYKYKKDRMTQEILPVIIDKHNHCLAEYSLVLTRRGEIPIRDVTTNDLVLTRKGWKKVLWAGVNGVNREVMELETTDGKVLRATPDHKVWTENRGFVRLDEIRYDDELLSIEDSSWQRWKLSTITGRDLEDIQTAKEEAIEFITRVVKHQAIYYSIERFIKTILEKFQKAFMCIIKMATLSIIQSTILNYFLRKIMQRYMNQKDLKKRKKSVQRIVGKLVNYLKNGILLKKVDPGINNMDMNLGEKIKMWLHHGKDAIGAMNHSKTNQFINVLYGVQINAKQQLGEHQGWTTLQRIARNVEKNSSPTNTEELKVVVNHVRCVRHIGIVEEKVYDLTVEDQHEFFTDSVLVSNCWDAIRYSLDGYIQRRGDIGIWARLAK